MTDQFIDSFKDIIEHWLDTRNYAILGGIEVWKFSPFTYIQEILV